MGINNCFEVQLSDYYPQWDIGDQVTLADILSLLKTSYAVCEVRTGAIFCKGTPFISTGVYLRGTTPASCFCPVQPLNHTGGRELTHVSILSITLVADASSKQLCPLSTDIANKGVQYFRGALMRSWNISYQTNPEIMPTPGRTLSVGGVASNCPKYISSFGNSEPLRIIPEVEAVVAESSGFVAPALFDIIYKNARKSAITPQIFLSIPSNDESYNYICVDPVFNIFNVINSFDGKVPFETETLSNGEYWIYIYNANRDLFGSNNYAFSSITCFVDNRIVTMLKKTVTINGYSYNIWMGRVPSIIKDVGKKYTKCRINIKTDSYQPTFEDWSDSTNRTTSYRCEFVAWLGGFSEDIYDL